jgi:hypothetical protein
MEGEAWKKNISTPLLCCYERMTSNIGSLGHMFPICGTIRRLMRPGFREVSTGILPFVGTSTHDFPRSWACHAFMTLYMDP